MRLQFKAELGRPKSIRFTLLELLVVIAIVGLLSLTLPAAEARDAASRGALFVQPPSIELGSSHVRSARAGCHVGEYPSLPRPSLLQQPGISWQQTCFPTSSRANCGHGWEAHTQDPTGYARSRSG